MEVKIEAYKYEKAIETAEQREASESCACYNSVQDNIKTAQEAVDKAIGRIETMISEREKTHGNFLDHARCTQRLKAVLRDELEIMGKILTMEQQEALDMIFHKIGRMVAGNANFIDHWDDLAGYSTLVAKALRGKL